ncbi:hypothetical protein K7432_001522 [Basidiobolus ranarum]|uniref:Glycosyltransferase n=1 Tax=Basidiobolus ranarum TaxID=34480 RepID=A0ABR2W9J1_9FUNG
MLTADEPHLYHSDESPLRVMNFQMFPGLFVTAGGPRSDRSLLEALAKRGNEALLFVACFFHETQNEQVIVDSVELIHPPMESSKDVRLFRMTVNQVKVVAYCMDDLDDSYFPKAFPAEWFIGKAENEQMDFLTQLIRQEVQRFQPTHFLCNSTLSLLVADTFMPYEISGIKTIVITHVTNVLPFGPLDVNPLLSEVWPEEFNSHYTKVMESKITGVWAVSKALKDYIYKYGSTKIKVKHFPLHPSRFDAANAPRHHNFDNPEARVVIINPGTIKGFSIFYSLAKKMVHTQFLAVKSWDVTEYQASLLTNLPNVELVPSMPTLEPIWERTKILLVPSLWLETFGNVVVEAMLRGIPVICSDVGGIPEAKCGVNYGIIPVAMATNEKELDEVEAQRHGPLKVRKNPILPWEEHVTSLLNDRALYERISEESYQASHKSLQIEDSAYEKFLREF